MYGVLAISGVRKRSTLSQFRFQQKTDKEISMAGQPRLTIDEGLVYEKLLETRGDPLPDVEGAYVLNTNGHPGDWLNQHRILPKYKIKNALIGLVKAGLYGYKQRGSTTFIWWIKPSAECDEQSTEQKGGRASRNLRTTGKGLVEVGRLLIGVAEGDVAELEAKVAELDAKVKAYEEFLRDRIAVLQDVLRIEP
jgi:hypothetical protein